jgi:hypothetical protein
MSSLSVSHKLIAFGFALTMALSFPLVASAQQNANPLNGIFSKTSGGISDDNLLARGGSRGGGGGSGGGRSAMRSPSRPSIGGGRSSGISHAGLSKLGQHHIQRPQTGAGHPRPSHPMAGQGQQPNIGQRPTQRPTNPTMNAGRPGQLPNQRPVAGQRPGNQPTRPTRPPNEFNASRSINVEGYDGGWGYHGEDYPWGLGTAAGLAGLTLGSALNSLPANSQPVVIQGEPYYESDGMYFEPSSGGGYTVVPPPVGAIEPQLPPGAKQVTIGGHTFYDVQGVYYQETLHNGQPAYMVVTP